MYTGSMSKKFVLIVMVLACLGIGTVVVVRREHAQAPASQSSGLAPNGQASPDTVSFDKKKYPTDQAASLWLVVNKKYALSPLEYIPSDLVIPAIPIRPNAGSDERKVSQQMAAALEDMVSAGQQAGVQLMLASGYRSYQTQVAVYNNEVQQYGQVVADTESARPGHSEHQTGLAADLEDATRQCEVADCFASLPEGKWLAENAATYGFIIRYPAGKDEITGYRYEPWHIRYVGVDLASEMKKQNVQTLEEFFNL